MAETRMVRLTDEQHATAKRLAVARGTTIKKVLEDAIALAGQVAKRTEKWRGSWNNWIAPFHACPHCGKSLNWEAGDDALEQPWIRARCDCVANPRNPSGGMVFNVELESLDHGRAASQGGAAE